MLRISEWLNPCENPENISSYFLTLLSPCLMEYQNGNDTRILYMLIRQWTAKFNALYNLFHIHHKNQYTSSVELTVKVAFKDDRVFVHIASMSKEISPEACDNRLGKSRKNSSPFTSEVWKSALLQHLTCSDSWVQHGQCDNWKPQVIKWSVD